MSSHIWDYSETDYRMCLMCHLEECFDDTQDKCIWVYSEMFMNSNVVC